MRYEPTRQHEASQKELLKTTIKMYHRPEPNNELKPKSNPCIAFTQQHQKPNNLYHSHNHHADQGFEELMQIYKKLSTALHRETVFFQQACSKLKDMTHRYYEELVKIIKASEKNAVREIQFTLMEAESKFATHLDSVAKSMLDYKNGSSKKSVDQIKAQFLQVLVVEAPVYKIEGNPFKDFERLINEFRPNFVHPTSNNKVQRKSGAEQKLTSFKDCIKKINNSSHQNKQNSPPEQQQGKKNTIKRNGGNGLATNSQICEFTCDEQFEWNPDGVKPEKKEFVSEIIFQEPSSCQDSLMLSQA